MLLIDIIILILIIYFGYKGYSKGILYTLFRFVSGIIAILIATHFSGWVASILFDTKSETAQLILPPIAFLITLILVALGLNVLFKIIFKPIQNSPLSSINKLLGALLNIAFIVLMFGSVIWILHSMDVINKSALESSYVSKYLLPIIPSFFEVLGTVIPIIKNTFIDLNDYFKQLASDIENTGN